jgi:hypothetical protein
MRTEDQSSADAAHKANRFIEDNMVKAQRLYSLYGKVTPTNKNMKEENDPLYWFGRAWHTVSDMTSPKHEGYQIWRLLDARSHANGESAEAFDAYRMGLAIGVSLQLYAYVFGPEELNHATGGTNFGSASDPNLRDLRRMYDTPDRQRLGYADGDYAESEYRRGLREGQTFDWVDQRGFRVYHR